MADCIYYEEVNEAFANPHRKLAWEELGFGMRSVQINSVLVSWSLCLRGLCKTRLKRVFLTDLGPSEIQPETLKKKNLSSYSLSYFYF